MKKLLLIFFSVIIALNFAACKKETLTEVPKEIKTEVNDYVSKSFENTAVSDFKIEYKINELTEESGYSIVNCSLKIDIGDLKESDCNKELYTLLTNMNGNLFWSTANFKSSDYEYVFYNNSLVSGKKEYSTESVLVNESNAEYVYKYSILCDSNIVWSIEETIPYVAK